MKRRYVDGRWGQVHLVEANPAARGSALVCLHATAYSSHSLLPFVEAVARSGRRVLALDTPGYGGSDPPPGQVMIEDYADGLAEVIAELGLVDRADLLGYHTGVAIAVEAALRHPRSAGRLVMIGVPLFAGATRADWRRRLVVEHDLGEDLAQFQERWQFLVAGRPEGMTLQRGFANFVDELRAWPNGWRAHHALFDHDLAGRLRALEQPVLVINPTSALAAMSREAAGLIPNVSLIERPDCSGAVFERHAGVLANLVEGFLRDGERRRAATMAAASLR